MLSLTVLPAITVGWISHQILFEDIRNDRMGDMGRIADAKREQLAMVLKRANERAQLFLSDLAAQCNGASLNRTCATRLMASYLASEEALRVAVHTTRGGNSLTVGAAAAPPAAALKFQPGQLASFSGTGPEKNRSYFILALDQSGKLWLEVTYPSSNLIPLFHHVADLGESGEAYLTDGAGYFATPPRYPRTQGSDRPSPAGPMQACLSGKSAEVLDRDYRDAKSIYGFRPIPEFGSACIMAHVDQAETFAPLAALDRRLYMALSIFLLSSIYIALVLARRMAKPVIDLSAAARAAAQEDVAARTGMFGSQVPWHDEISELASTFSIMTKRLTSANTQLEQKAVELTHEKRLVRRVIDSDPSLIFINDAEGRILLANEAMAKIFGQTTEGIVGKYLSELTGQAGQVAAFNLNYRKVIETYDERASMETVQLGGSEVRWFYTIRKPLIWNDCSAVLLTIAVDVTELKQAQDEQQKINRALRLLSVCNMVLAHAEDEEQLLARICRLIVRTGGYRMVWVGYAQDDEEKSVHAAAKFGFDPCSLESTRVSWADMESGGGPIGLAIRTGTTQVKQRLETKPHTEESRGAASACGCQASIVLPLKDPEKTFGALTIYALEPDAFDVEEIKLLEELADNLAYGIMMQRLRARNRQAEEALQRSEEQFRLLVQHLPQRIFVKDVNSSYLSCNELYARDLGIEPDAIAGKTDFDFYPQEEAETYRASDREVLDTGNTRQTERTYVRGGEQRIYSTIKVPFKDAQGRMIGVLGMFWDVTEQRRADERIRRSEQNLAEAQRIARMGSWQLDLRSNVLTWSDENYRIFGVAREKFGASYETFLDVVHPDDRELVNRIYTESVKSKTPYELVHRLMMKDGRVKYVHERCETYYDEDGEPLRSVGTTQDISERKALEERRNQLSEAVRHSGEAIALADQNNRFIYVNPAFSRLFGYSMEEAVGKVVDELIGVPGESFGQPQQTYEFAERRGTFRGETSRRNKDGRIVPVLLTLSAMRDEHGRTTAFVANLFDLTERKKAEAELFRQKQFMWQIIDTDPNLIFVKDAAGKCLLVNQALADCYGLTTQEMIGKHPLEFNPDRNEALAYLEADRKVIENRQESISTTTTMRPDGRQHWYLTIKKPLVEADGEVNVLGIAVDITEQTLAQMKLTESYKELQRLSTHLENLREEERAKIARDLHDEMGALLVALKMRVAWLASKLPAEMPLLAEETGHISTLVAEAIGAMHQTVMDLRPNLQEGFGFAATVEDYVKKFEQRTGIECSLVMPEEGVELEGSQSITLFRILQESLNNVAKHSRASAVNIVFTEQDKSLSLVIEDNGIGFDPAEHRERSFGLLGIRERALMMGGRTTITSTPGKGTQVSVTFTPHEAAGLI